MFPVTLTVSNIAQLTAIMAALGTNPVQATVTHNGASKTPESSLVVSPAAVAAPETAPVIASAATGAASDTAKKPDAAKTPAATAPIPPTATAEAAVAPEKKADATVVTFEELKVAFLALVNTNREKAKAVLTQFGLPSKLSEATPEQYGEIFAAIKAA